MKPLKAKAIDWIISICEQCSINDKEKLLMDCFFNFKLEGFADEPEVYIKSTLLGLEIGYEATLWLDGHTPVAGLMKKHLLTWETLQSLNNEKQQEMILELLMKTIHSRKRQYRKCQFCEEKLPVEHRFDKDTCFGCASERWGIVY
ncbi:hypothetical protein [Neobacillus citreus]|uniref:Uncharacterized protein n=1 Tax=Neobacillus citreus TaxID=2833578 RepID=A0A942YDG2_9BACI|nr:hypothetical protein [Neobacillus citreus]MCH6265080.1 hypothetical protein [Neobacillus citreus]